MSKDRSLSEVIDSIGRLQVGAANKTVLAGLAILRDGRSPVERCVRWAALSAGGAIFAWWRGFFG